MQWGDPDGKRPLGEARDKLPPEFTVKLGPAVPFEAMPDRDGYAPEVGFSQGFPAARDAARGEAWLTHCYGMVGAGRGNEADSGNGTELYVVTGHAPRQLDRNIALVGRVVQGMELLSTLPRGSGPLGFYEQPERHVPIASVRLAADLPAAERVPLEVLRTDTASFRALVEARRNRRDEWYLVPAGYIDVCNVPIAVRTPAKHRDTLDFSLGNSRVSPLRGDMNMERIWLEHYPPGVPHDVDVTQYSSLVQLLEEGFRKHASRNAYAYMDRFFTFADVDRLFGRARRLAAGARARPRRAGRPHDAERRAVPDRRRRRAARRVCRRQRQSALHAARARAPAQGFGRRGHRDPRELRGHAAAGGRENRSQARHRRLARRHARFPEGRDRQFHRAQAAARWCPGTRCPDTCASPTCSMQVRARSSLPCRSGGRTSPSCSTRAARPACPRAPR